LVRSLTLLPVEKVGKELLRNTAPKRGAGVGLLESGQPIEGTIKGVGCKPAWQTEHAVQEYGSLLGEQGAWGTFARNACKKSEVQSLKAGVEQVEALSSGVKPGTGKGLGNVGLPRYRCSGLINAHEELKAHEGCPNQERGRSR